MTIQIGEQLPRISFIVMGPEGPAVQSAEQIFKGKKVVLFGVAGAFTPICDAGFPQQSRRVQRARNR
jgi:glutaredoxin/glutathione-dependent peroxiredoxin